MSLLRSLLDGLHSLLRKERAEDELDEELRGLVEMATEAKMKQGMGREHALRAVRLERGSLELAKEVVRSAGGSLLSRHCGRICVLRCAFCANLQA